MIHPLIQHVTKPYLAIPQLGSCGECDVVDKQPASEVEDGNGVQEAAWCSRCWLIAMMADYLVG